jgi:hypothetical protein
VGIGRDKGLRRRDYEQVGIDRLHRPPDKVVFTCPVVLDQLLAASERKVREYLSLPMVVTWGLACRPSCNPELDISKPQH